MVFAKPRAWYSHIDQQFIKMGFIQKINEPTIYKKIRGNSDILLLCIYIDDIIYMLSEFKENMLKTFEMTYLRPLRYFLGLEVKQSNGVLFVS